MKIHISAALLIVIASSTTNRSTASKVRGVRGHRRTHEDHIHHPLPQAPLPAPKQVKKALPKKLKEVHYPKVANKGHHIPKVAKKGHPLPLNKALKGPPVEPLGLNEAPHEESVPMLESPEGETLAMVPMDPAVADDMEEAVTPLEDEDKGFIEKVLNDRGYYKKKEESEPQEIDHSYHQLADDDDGEYH